MHAPTSHPTFSPSMSHSHRQPPVVRIQFLFSFFSSSSSCNIRIDDATACHHDQLAHLQSERIMLLCRCLVYCHLYYNHIHISVWQSAAAACRFKPNQYKKEKKEATRAKKKCGIHFDTMPFLL